MSAEKKVNVISQQRKLYVMIKHQDVGRCVTVVFEGHSSVGTTG